jgi:hypothetical protein
MCFLAHVMRKILWLKDTQIKSISEAKKTIFHVALKEN